MNNLEFTIKKGSVGAVMVATLSDESGPVDLTSKTVTVKAKKGATIVLNNAACTVDADPTTGKVSYTFGSEINTISADEYQLEFKVVQGGNTDYFPTSKTGSRTYGILRVQESL